MPERTRMVKIADIVVPETRATSQYDEDQREELAASISAEGMIDSILLADDGEQLILADGLNRLRDAITKGATEIEARVRKGTLQDVHVWNLSTIYFRGTPKIAEEVAVIKELEEDWGMGSDEIAKRTGMKQSRVEQLQWAARAHPSVQAALDDGALSIGHAAEFAKRLSPDEQEVLLPFQLQNRWPIAKLREYIQATEEQRAHIRETETATPIQVTNQLATCGTCGEQWDPAQLRAVIVCPSCQGTLLDINRRIRAAAAEDQN